MMFTYLVQKIDIGDGEYSVTGQQTKFQDLAGLVSELLKYLFPFAGILLFIYLILGGFSYLTSGGDPKAMEQAKGKVTNAIVGFLIIFIAFWLVQILEFMFGIKGSMFGP